MEALEKSHGKVHLKVYFYIFLFSINSDQYCAREVVISLTKL